MRTIDEVIIHTSATRPLWMHNEPFVDQVTEITRWHVEDNGWSDVGYHFLIGRTGERAIGRPAAIQGAHVRGHNANSIGVCLLGGHGGNATDRFLDNYTVAQEKTLIDLLDGLKVQYPTIRKISGHNDYSPKACPCFNVADWLKSVREPQLPLDGGNTGKSNDWYRWRLAELRDLAQKALEEGNS